MKLIISDKDRKVEVECSLTLDIYAMLDEICSLLVAWGYHSKSIEDAIITKAEEYENSSSEKNND